MFILRNKEYQMLFKEATTAANNNHYLSSVFDEHDDLDTQTEKFMKRLQKTINKCFRKVRITDRIDEEKEELFKKWREMKNNPDDVNNDELEKVETNWLKSMPMNIMRK